MRIFAYCTPAMLALFVVSSVQAQECDPTKFTLRDYERLDFSQSLQLAVLDILDTESEETRNSQFDMSAVVKGVPIKVGYEDARRISNYAQQTNSMSFSKDEKINWFKSNPSIVGAQMYQACLDAMGSEFKVSFLPSAYRGGEFPFTIIWTPTESLAEGETTGQARVEVYNGTADGQREASKPIVNGKKATFRINRIDDELPITIVPSVNDLALAGGEMEIVVPPALETKLVAVRRIWPDPERAESGFPLPIQRGDEGSPYGSTAWSSVQCITSDRGMLLPSTLAITHSGSSTPTPMRVTEPGRDEATSVCVRFAVLGVDTFGKGGYSSLDTASFSVVEIYPEE